MSQKSTPINVKPAATLATKMATYLYPLRQHMLYQRVTLYECSMLHGLNEVKFCMSAFISENRIPVLER